MTFSYGVNRKTVFGNLKVSNGYWTNSATGDGGQINTGLKRIESITMTYAGTTVLHGAAAKRPLSIAESFTSGVLNQGTVTLVTATAMSGLWEAKGR